MSLDTGAKNTWCPGCGHFGIMAAAKSVMQEMIDNGEKKHEDFVIA